MISKKKKNQPQRPIESWRSLFEALTHLFAHTALTHLDVLSGVLKEAVVMNQGTTGAEPEEGELPTLFYPLIQAHQSFHSENRLSTSVLR